MIDVLDYELDKTDQEPPEGGRSATDGRSQRRRGSPLG